MSPLLLAWYGQSPTTRALWWAAGAGMVLSGLQWRFAADLWTRPDAAVLVAQVVLGLSWLLLAWLGPGLLWQLGRYCQRWWLRLLSVTLAVAGWCLALLVSLLGPPLVLGWAVFSAGN